MTFVYPAVFTPKKDGKGYDAYFPDFDCCEAEGPDLEDDMSLPEGSMVKQIMVRIKLLPDND